MKRYSLTLAVLVVTSAVFSSRAAAQRTYALGIGGGVAIPVGKLKNTQNSGLNGMVSLALGVAELPIGVRFDGIYNNFKPGNTTTGHDFRITGVLGNLIYAFSGTNAKAYIVTGGGWYSTRLDVAGAQSENYWGLNAGLGLTFGLGPIAGFAESRYHFISRQPAKGGVIHFVPITLGLLF